MSRDLIGKRFVVLRSPEVSEAAYGRTGIAEELIPEWNTLVLKLDDMFPKEYITVKRTDVYQVYSNEEPSDTVCEDPPVAVPGYVPVTVKEDLIVSCSDRQDEEKPPLRRMIPLSSIEGVSAREDGTSWIYLKGTVPCAPMYAPPLHVAEDFDEVSRRMRTAAIGEDIVI